MFTASDQKQNKILPNKGGLCECNALGTLTTIFSFVKDSKLSLQFAAKHIFSNGCFPLGSLKGQIGSPNLVT